MNRFVSLEELENELERIGPKAKRAQTFVSNFAQVKLFLDPANTMDEYFGLMQEHLRILNEYQDILEKRVNLIKSNLPKYGMPIYNAGTRELTI